MRAAGRGGGDSGSAEPQAAVTGRRVLIGREVLVYLAEQGRLDVDDSTFWGLESAVHPQRIPDDEHGHVSGGNAVSGVHRLVVPRDRGHQLSGQTIFFTRALHHVLTRGFPFSCRSDI